MCKIICLALYYLYNDWVVYRKHTDIFNTILNKQTDENVWPLYDQSYIVWKYIFSMVELDKCYTFHSNLPFQLFLSFVERRTKSNILFLVLLSYANLNLIVVSTATSIMNTWQSPWWEPCPVVQLVR